jgi:hypothetical protein
MWPGGPGTKLNHNCEKIKATKRGGVAEFEISLARVIG